MSGDEVTKEGQVGVRPGREAMTGVHAGRRKRRRRGGEQPVVPEAEFTSYYGKPVLNKPVWEAPDIPGYLYLGGLGGAGSLLAAGATLSGRSALARVMKLGATSAASLGTVALVHDLGRPGRFFNMLRVFKPTSPMSVGSWLLAAYSPAAAVAAFADVTGRLRLLGNLGTVGAAVFGPGLAAYTGALLSDTAVPAWHAGYRHLPIIFAASGASAAGGLGLVAAPLAESGPARRMAVAGTVIELGVSQAMEQSLGFVAEPYRKGVGGRYVKAAKALGVAGTAGAMLGRRSRLVSALSGAALMLSSLSTRWGIFKAGIASAEDPQYTVRPQRERVDAQGNDAQGNDAQGNDAHGNDTHGNDAQGNDAG